MQECKDLKKINEFLTLMGYKKISEESNPNTKYMIIDNVAFIGYSIYFERAEIDYLYVKEEYRNKGYASKLVDYVIKQNFENITLEVNKKNVPAINLYKKFNFEIVAERKQYYKGEDAYLMMRK